MCDLRSHILTQYCRDLQISLPMCKYEGPIGMHRYIKWPNWEAKGQPALCSCMVFVVRTLHGSSNSHETTKEI